MSTNKKIFPTDDMELDWQHPGQDEVPGIVGGKLDDALEQMQKELRGVAQHPLVSFRDFIVNNL